MGAAWAIAMSRTELFIFNSTTREFVPWDGTVTGGTGGGTTGGATETTLAQVRDRLPGTLGAKTAANSFPVTLSTDGAFATNFGAQADAVATTDTGSFSLIGLVKRLLSKFQVGPQPIANSVSVAIASDQSLHVIGSTVCISDIFTRPADTTAYAVDDVVSNSATATTPLTFTNAARTVNGTGYIVSARMSKSTATVANASFRLWLYRDLPTTPPVDNSPFALLFANRAVRMGFIDFTLSTAGAGSNSASDFKVGLNIPFFAINGRNLYGVLVARGAYTPANGEQFFVEIGLEQN